MLARTVNSVFGVWLMLAHWVLGYADREAAFNEIAVGFGVFVTALLSGCVRPFHYLLTLAGAWLLISPLVLSYDGTAPSANSAILGALLIAASLIPRHWRYWSHRHPASHGVPVPTEPD